MIECPKCQHDNDLGRIFCAKCGEKLEISKLRAPSRLRKGKKRGESFQKTATQAVIKFVKITMLAAFAALITCIWLPPQLQMRPFTEKDVAAFQGKREKLEEAINNQQPATIVFLETDLNAIMDQMLKGASKGKPSDGMSLENVYIKLKKENVLVTIQSKWKWFRLAVQVVAEPQNKNGRWQFKAKKIGLGRLIVPPYFHSQISDSFVKKLWASFETEKQWIEQLSTIQIMPGYVELSTAKAE